MKITTLALYNFRNFRTVDEIVFPQQQTLLVAAAPNATGKTNFLEAIHFLLRGKSWRGTPADCVGWGEDWFQIGARLNTRGGDSFLSVRYDGQHKTVRFEQDEEPVSIVKFYRQYPFILFLPEDTFLFVRGPAGRRNLLNSVLISSPAYLSSLVQYYRILRQRNAALKGARTPDDVMVWTNLLVEQAGVLWGQRQALVEFFNSHLPELYQALSGEEAKVVVELVMGLPAGQENLPSALHDVWSQEQRYQYTMYGPHRDDGRVLYNDHPVKTALSRGQMRLLVLALKILSWQYIKQTLGEEPLLLMDEVLSELDADKQHRFLANLPAGQTLLTCTSLPEELKRQDNVHRLDLRRILHVGKPTPVLERVPA